MTQIFVFGFAHIPRLTMRQVEGLTPQSHSWLRPWARFDWKYDTSY